MEKMNDMDGPQADDLPAPQADTESLKEVIRQKDTLIADLTQGVETQKQQIVRDMVGAIERVVLPLLTTLDAQLSQPQRSLLQTAVANLKDLLSPFVKRLDEELAVLTPTELRICSLIRQGLSVKEIAAAEQTSPATISTHRRSIRRKIGLAHSKMNLATFLNRRPPLTPPANPQ